MYFITIINIVFKCSSGFKPCLFLVFVCFFSPREIISSHKCTSSLPSTTSNGKLKSEKINFMFKNCDHTMHGLDVNLRLSERITHFFYRATLFKPDLLFCAIGK